MARIVRLPERSYVAVEGPDAEKLLQGLITNDVGDLEPGRATHAGLLSPQGKILFEFIVVRVPAGFWLETTRAQAADLVKRLTFYKLRAKADIASKDGLDVYAVWGETAGAVSGVVAYADPRHAALGRRVARPADAPLQQTDPPEAYHAHRISLGVPEAGLDYALGDTFPHEAVFDLLGGVAFDKGCFVGQEVVSRMQHRGTARRRFVIVDGDAPLPPAGVEIVAGSGDARVLLGAMGSSVSRQGLALIRIDRAAEGIANNMPITAGGAGVALRVPEWATYSLTPTLSPAQG